MGKIAESELILNSRGAAYHLDVRPEELASTIITVGDPDRVKEVSKHFDNIEFKLQHREFVTHTGTLGNTRISVVSTGIGPDNIDIVVNELDALVNIDFETRTIKPELSHLNIIRLGTSGSLQEDIPVDSFVVSTHGLGIDNLLNYYRHENNDEEMQIVQQFVAHTQINSNFSYPYISAAGSALLKNFVDGYHHGITVTCPGFYGPQGRVLRLGLTNPDLIDRLTAFSLGPHYNISSRSHNHLTGLIASTHHLQFQNDDHTNASLALQIIPNIVDYDYLISRNHYLCHAIYKTELSSLTMLK